MKYRVLVFFIYQFSFSQGYDIFNVRRDGNSLNCPPPPNGQFFDQPASIGVLNSNNGISIRYTHTSNSIPSKYYYNLEDMIKGIGNGAEGGGPKEGGGLIFPKRKIANDILYDLSSLCFRDFLYFFSVAPRNLYVNLSTPTTQNNGDNSTGDLVTLTATPNFHELAYNWEFLPPPGLQNLFSEVTSLTAGRNFDAVGAGSGSSSKSDFSIGNWKKFPEKFIGKSNITFNAQDLFGEHAHLLIGKSVKFRIRMINGWTSDEIFSFVFILGSPKFTGLTSNNNTCNYSDDASFSLTVDRQLIPGERMVVSPYFEHDNEPGVYSLYKQRSTEVNEKLVDNLDNTYSYIWKGDLPKGKYKVKFQTYTISSGIIDEDHPSWRTLEYAGVDTNKGDFAINEVAKVNFKAEKINDKSCFNKNDGKIRISDVSGESDRIFSYIITEPDGTSNEVQFNGNSTIVSGLSLGKHVIKVKDNKGCLAK